MVAKKQFVDAGVCCMCAQKMVHEAFLTTSSLTNQRLSGLYEGRKDRYIYTWLLNVNMAAQSYAALE